MRKALLLLIVAASLAACGKKQPPANPSNTNTMESNEEQDKAKADGQSEDAMKSSDPCEGGQ